MLSVHADPFELVTDCAITGCWVAVVSSSWREGSGEVVRELMLWIKDCGIVSVRVVIGVSQKTYAVCSLAVCIAACAAASGAPGTDGVVHTETTVWFSAGKRGRRHRRNCSPLR